MRPWWRLPSRAKAPRRNCGVRPQVEFLENRLLPNSLFGPWGGSPGGLDLAFSFGGGDQRPPESRTDQDLFGTDDADWMRKILSRDDPGGLLPGTGNYSDVGVSSTAVTLFSPNGQ